MSPSSTNFVISSLKASVALYYGLGIWFEFYLVLNGYHMSQIMIACSKEIWEIFEYFKELILFLRTQVIRKHRLEMLGSSSYHFFRWVGSIQNIYLLISEVLPLVYFR